MNDLYSIVKNYCARVGVLPSHLIAHTAIPSTAYLIRHSHDSLHLLGHCQTCERVSEFFIATR